MHSEVSKDSFRVYLLVKLNDLGWLTLWRKQTKKSVSKQAAKRSAIEIGYPGINNNEAQSAAIVSKRRTAISADIGNRFVGDRRSIAGIPTLYYLITPLLSNLFGMEI